MVSVSILNIFRVDFSRTFQKQSLLRKSSRSQKSRTYPVFRLVILKKQTFVSSRRPPLDYPFAYRRWRYAVLNETETAEWQCEEEVYLWEGRSGNEYFLPRALRSCLLLLVLFIAPAFNSRVKSRRLLLTAGN